MQKNYDLIIVIPVGPAASVSFTADTINSIAYNITCSYKIILIDDSQKGLGAEIQKQFLQTDLLLTPQNNGRLCGLYITLCTAYKYAVNNYRFHLLFKVDTDALIINKNPEADAFELFNNNSSIGMAGQYPSTYKGTQWDISWPQWSLNNQLTAWRKFKHFRNFILNYWYKKALHRGYKTGESVFGGSYFISGKCLKVLNQKGLLPMRMFKKLNLEEDHLFSLLVKAVGFDLGDLSSGNLPFACAWKELPASPEKLFDEGKKVIHSTREYKNLNEADIRRFFQKVRNNAMLYQQ